MSTRFRTSRLHDPVAPKPPLDAHQRYRTYGPIQPMDSPSFLERIFGKR